MLPLSVSYLWNYQRKLRGCWRRAGTVRISLHHVRPMLCFCLSYSQHSCTLPATGRSWCPRSIQVMCISSDTLSGALFPAVGRVASYTAGCSLQITEPDLSAVWTLSVFRLRNGLPYQVWYHSCFGSTNYHKAWLNTSEATAVYRCLFKATLLQWEFWVPCYE